jgi:hypothetical protein
LWDGGCLAIDDAPDFLAAECVEDARAFGDELGDEWCVWGRVAFDDALEAAVADLEEGALIGGDPDAVVRECEEAGEGEAEAAEFAIGLDGHEFDAVEACDAFRGGDPEVSVRGLDDGADDVSGEAVFGLPDADKRRWSLAGEERDE